MSWMLDLIRGVSALAVAIGHFRSLFFVEYKSLEAVSGIGTQLFYFFTGFGHQSVIVFFVLSGFMVGGSSARSLKRGYWSPLTYLVQRLVRLEVVLLPALLIGAFWDGAGLKLFGEASVYGGGQSSGNIILGSVASRMDFLTYLGNAFFLQTAIVPTAGSNSPLWSLCYEFVYYLLFMLLLLLWRYRKLPQKAIVPAILMVGISYYFWMQVRGGFHVWLLGFALVFVRPSLELKIFEKWGLRLLGLVGLGIFILSRVYLKMGDDVLGVAVTLVFLLILRDSSFTPQVKVLSVFSKWLAERSFTLYATHFPLAVFLRATLLPGERWQFTPLNVLFFLGIVVALMAYTEVLYRAFEANTFLIRNYVLSKLEGFRREETLSTPPLSPSQAA